MLKDLDDFCKSNGIERQHTIRNEPHQNGVAERANRDIAEHATAMLMEARLPASFWGCAVQTYAYVRNRLPTSALRVPLSLRKRLVLCTPFPAINSTHLTLIVHPWKS